MTPPVKDNAHIRSDRQAFMDAYLRARTVLGQIEGVVGVGFGRKETAEAFTDNVAIQVFVREKKPEDALPPEQRIPPTFEGYRTDVRIVPAFVPVGCDNQTRYPRIQGGIQIQARDKDSTVSGDPGKGTLGCIVKKRNDSGVDNAYLLTCDHALFHETSGLDGYVYHPSAPAPGDSTSAQLVGIIETYGKKEEVPFGIFDCYVDCAIVQIDPGSRCLGTHCSEGVPFETKIVDLNPGPMAIEANRNRITDVRNVITDVDIALPDSDLATATDQNRVFKVGRTTGRTVGIVTGVNVPVEDTVSGVGIVFRHGVIEVAFDPASEPSGLNCKGNEAFVEGGDSGAIVVDKDNRAIGLVFGGRRVPRPEGSRKYPAYVCHIVPVLDALGICIPTTGGTLHGSSAATDGSGTALYSPGSRLPATEGTTLFSSLGVSDARSARAPLPEPAAVTDEQRACMHALSDALRETARGRRLHDTFTEVLREISYLVRRSRPVKVVWHRNRGPAFLACVLNHLRGDAATIPREIGGVSRATLLARMGKVLFEHGSNPLRAAIERHRDELMLLADAQTVQECLEILRRAEAEVPA